jgi:hypothetical protein
MMCIIKKLIELFPRVGLLSVAGNLSCPDLVFPGLNDLSISNVFGLIAQKRLGRPPTLLEIPPTAAVTKSVVSHTCLRSSERRRAQWKETKGLAPAACRRHNHPTHPLPMARLVSP